jgi:hypothetical protein
MISIRFQVSRSGPEGKASDQTPSLCADDEQEQETNQTTLDKVEWPSAFKTLQSSSFSIGYRCRTTDTLVCVRINTKTNYHKKEEEEK